jgi:hypothetical protein
MYILKKQLPFLPNTPFYRGTPGLFRDIDFDHRSFGTFKRHRAKIFRWYFQAWYSNLWFKGEIEKIHIRL